MQRDQLRDSMTVAGLQRLQLLMLQRPGLPLSALGSPAPTAALPAPIGG